MIAPFLLVGGLAAAATPCESLKSLSLPNTTITVAELVPAGPYTPPAFGGAPPPAPAAGRGQAAAAGGGRGGRAARPRRAAADAAGALPRRARSSSRRPIRRSRWKPGCRPRLERQVPGGRQRRLGRHDQLCGDGRPPCRKATPPPPPTPATRAATRLRPRPSGEAHRLRLSRHARDDREGQGADRGLLRRAPRLSYWNGCSTGGRRA